MRTKVTTLALVAGVMLAGTVAFAQYSQPSTASSAVRSRMRSHRPTAKTSARLPAGARTAASVSIVIDSKPFRTATPPVIMRGSAFVPVREIFDRFGATVMWKAPNREVDAVKGSQHVVLYVGSTSATVDGRTMRLASAPFIYQGRVYVPLRFVSESLGGTATYNSAARRIAINTRGRQIATGPSMRAIPGAVPAGALPANARLLSGTRIVVDGATLSTSAAPVEIGRTMLVPAQPIFSRLAVRTTWNASQHRLTAIRDGEQIVVIAGDRNAKIGSRTERLSEAPFVYDNDVYLPLDFVSRALNVQATWDASRKEVMIASIGRHMATTPSGPSGSTK